MSTGESVYGALVATSTEWVPELTAILSQPMACTAAWQSPMTYRQLQARELTGGAHLHHLVPGPLEVGPIPADASAPDDTAERLLVGVDDGWSGCRDDRHLLQLRRQL